MNTHTHTHTHTHSILMHTHTQYTPFDRTDMQSSMILVMLSEFSCSASVGHVSESRNHVTYKSIDVRAAQVYL